jgi:predicted permease
MLFALGVRLRDADWTHWRIGLLGAALRPAAGLVSALGVLALLPLDDPLARQLLLFAVLPPAVLNYVLAERYDQDPQAVASIVIWGNLGALISIPLTLALILP